MMKNNMKGAKMRKNILFTTIVFLMLTTMHITLLPQEKLKIAIVPKSGSTLFWKSVKVGAKLGATALSGVEIVWNAPKSEDDIQQQISILEQNIASGVSGIVLSPIHKDALAVTVSKAMSKGIPVLIFDSVLKGEAGKDFICFVGIDNRKAGKLAGEHLAKLLNYSGKVVLFRYVKGQGNTTEREEGFLDAIKAYNKIQVIEKDCYAGGTIEEAKKAGESILSKLRSANGVFCPNELSTIGMMLTLQKANLAGKIKFIGFDTPTIVVEALKKGEIDALIAQDPARIGYQSVKCIVDFIRGTKIPTSVDIDVKIVTKENIDDPEIQKLLALPSVTE